MSHFRTRVSLEEQQSCSAQVGADGHVCRVGDSANVEEDDIEVKHGAGRIRAESGWRFNHPEHPARDTMGWIRWAKMA